MAPTSPRSWSPRPTPCQLPDVVNVNLVTVNALARAKFLLDFDAKAPEVAAQFVPSIWNSITPPGVQGHPALPWYWSPAVLTYNADLMTKAGLDPNKPPTTVMEMLDMSAQIAAKSSGNFTAMLANPRHRMVQEWVAMGAKVISDDNKRFVFADDPKIQQWLVKYQVPEHAIITRHRIVERYRVEGQPAIGARILVGTAEVVVWNLHLYYQPYGPYELMEGANRADVLAREDRSTRPQQIRAILDGIASSTADGPAFLAGDFNAPSHLDRPEIPWPVSTAVHDAGWSDSYRDAHPDPVTHPGHTWSPIVKARPSVSYPEPQDRIDFIYYRRATVLGSRTVVEGVPRPAPDHRYNAWPTDHAAVATTFRLP